MPQKTLDGTNHESLADSEAVEQGFLDVCEVAPVAYLTLDGNGRIQAANAAATERLRLPAANLIGHPFVRFVLKGHKRALHRHLQTCKSRTEAASCELVVCPHEGQPIPVRLDTVRVGELESVTYRVAITERRDVENNLLLYARVLSIINRSGERVHVLRDVLREIKRSTGFDAVGIRLREGEDYPYFVTTGFADEFVAAERFLCTQDPDGHLVRDASGRADLDCMCGVVIRGDTDATRPFFTEAGSFWTNSTTQLLASTGQAPLMTRTRNRCHGEGYESVALIPLRAGHETIGLLQLNDCRRDRFTSDRIRFFEGLGAAIGIGFSRQQAEQALRDSESRYRLVAQNLTDVIWTASIQPEKCDSAPQVDTRRAVIGENFLRRWQFSFVSPSIQDLLGYDAADAMNLSPKDLLTPRSYATLLDRLGVLLATADASDEGMDEQQTLELEHVTSDGGRRWCDVTFKFIRESGRGIVGLLGSVRDIGERRELEQALADLAADERAEIGRGLHDGLGQQLTGIGYLAESLRSDLQEQAPLLVGQARRLVQATQQALDQMRKIAKGMLPVEIDPLGLMSALEQLVESTQQLYGIRGSFCCPHPVAVPDATLATELFRIAQEAVGNIARHSQGQSLEITLAVNENVLCLAIRDDGVGIANRGSKADGLGLRIMRYRAGLIGASLEFQGLETGGTIVTCRLALEDEDDRSSHAAEDDVQGSDRR